MLVSPGYWVGGGCRQLQVRANGHHQTFDSLKFLGRVLRNYHWVYHKTFCILNSTPTFTACIMCVRVRNTYEERFRSPPSTSGLFKCVFTNYMNDSKSRSVWESVPAHPSPAHPGWAVLGAAKLAGIMTTFWHKLTSISHYSRHSIKINLVSEGPLKHNMTYTK